VLERIMKGNRPRGRPRISMIDDLKEYVRMKRRAEDRVDCRS